MTNKNIPVSEGKILSDKFGYDMTFILAVNNDQSGHLVTYGKNKNFCKLAEKIGKNLIADLVFDKGSVFKNIKIEELLCEHNYQIIEIIKNKESNYGHSESRDILFQKNYIYHCSKCLVEKITKKEFVLNGWNEILPDWAIDI